MHSRSQIQQQDLSISPQQSVIHHPYQTISYSKNKSVQLASPNLSNISSSAHNHHNLYNIQINSQDVKQVMDMLCAKNTRLFIKFSNNRLLLDQFKQHNLYNNTFMKIAIRKILYELANDRKLGNNLKGMSKLLYQQIQDQIWELIQIQIKLFRKQDQLDKLEHVFKKDPAQMFKM